jgi:hypothetical protein
VVDTKAFRFDGIDEGLSKKVGQVLECISSQVSHVGKYFKNAGEE